MIRSIATIVVALGAFAAAQQTTPNKPVSPPATGARDANPTAPPPAANGAISGTLVAADTGRTVRRARITLTGGDVRTVKSVTTDDHGAFSFTGLSAGEFTISASKGGYLDLAYGQRRPGAGQSGTPIRLLANQQIPRLSLAILRGGVITGTITDEAGDPAFGVSVRAMRYVWRAGERALQQAGTGSTDDRGIYRIPALSPGDYVVSATPSMDAGMEQKVQVEMMAADLQRRMQTGASSPAASADLKAMMDGLNSGAATVPEVSSGYAPVYYSGTTQAAAASTVTLGASEEKGGVDMQLQVVALATISGSVMSGQGALGGVQLQLVDRSQPSGIGVKSARGAADGTFSFTGVAPGQYTLMARGTVRDAAPADAPAIGLDPAGKQAAVAAALAEMGRAPATATPQLWAMTDVTVDGRNLSNLSLVLQRGMTVSGSVSFEGGNAPAPAQLSRMSVAIATAMAGGAGDFILPPPAQLDGEGRFIIRGAAPGVYRVVPSGGTPPGFTMKSAVFAGRDVLDIPLEIKSGEDQGGGILTFSTRTSDVTGQLQDTAGAPAPGYTVVVFAADARYWLPQSRRIQATRPATDGRFMLRALPAGDYRIVAVSDPEAGQWYDPAFLRQIVAASFQFTLGEGERRTQDLRIK